MADAKKPETKKTAARKLTAATAEDLRQELYTRQAKPSEDLSEFDDVSLIKQVKYTQKVIYGTDDRQDVFQLTQQADLNDVDCVVALFRDTDVIDNGNGTSTLQTQNFGTARNLCASERFRDQPIGAFCSGFLVAPDVIATAGHCADTSDVTTIRFVFGFRMANATTAATVINNNEIYSGVSVIGRQEVATGPDWALVRIDRAVTNHRIAPIRRTGIIGDTQAVHVIGHPVGLPTKFAGGAAVRNNQPAAFFVANLDTYGGNSGSPVFNSTTREVEGILVRGETDFAMQGTCRVSLVCPTSGCRGEDCTRTTEFATLVPTAIRPGVKKVVDDPPTPLIKKVRDDSPRYGVKKAIDDPPVSFKKTRDDGPISKKIRDDVTGKPFRDPIPPIGGGGILPFSLAIGHHVKLGGGIEQAEALAQANMSAIQQQWLDTQAALTQARATAAQADADASRLEEAIYSLEANYAELVRQLGGGESEER
jgi:hypothetical protein